MPSISQSTPPTKSSDEASMETQDNLPNNKDSSQNVESPNGEPAAQVSAAPSGNTETPPEQESASQDPSGTSTLAPSSSTDAHEFARRASAGLAAGDPSSPISNKTSDHVSASGNLNLVSEWSHQQLAIPAAKPDKRQDYNHNEEWQEMPAYAPFDIYNDDGKLVARENEIEEGPERLPDYLHLAGHANGYTRVQLEEDAESATSFDDNTAYLFKEPGTNIDEDEEARDAIAQMQATKDLLTGNQRIAYVGVVRLAMSELTEQVQAIERTKKTKKDVDFAVEAMKLWSQKMMVRLYSHMELEQAEQIMIEQLAVHGLRASDLVPTLKQNARVKNPMATQKSSEVDEDDPNKQASDQTQSSKDAESNGKQTKSVRKKEKDIESKTLEDRANGDAGEPLPPYEEIQTDATSVPDQVQLPSDMPQTEDIDIDIRWTILCDLFLILISDSMYDSRSRVLFEKVGAFLDVSEIDICRFEKRVTEALEMEEEARKEDWNEDDHMEARRKAARRRRLALMGLATVGGGLVIGLSAGLLAPLIGAGLASGLGVIGISGTSTFLGGVGGAALIGGGGVLAGGSIGVRAANRRTGAVKTFEYRPLHNNKRVNLIVTVAGWMNGKVDDVRLPFSTVDPVMGDMYSIHWEPEMLRSMGDTINILATEALTQGLQQILGSTILIGLMAALQLPIVLSKLSYLIDNPWSNSLARADLAGLILADSLIDRNLGARPITLVGFSIGSRVIFAALRELANKGALGLIHNVVLFGSPVVAKKDDYLRARTVVSGRFINGYATNDWILGYLFRATAGGIGRVAGLAKVEVEGIENIDVTENVPGHMAYRQSMPKLLRQIGWVVTSDEFTEIEDPDPENHERRQRELINEIEEARKDIQEKKKKKKFDVFGMRKKWLQKNEWETYDERMVGVTEDEAGKGLEQQHGEGALFDIEAIRKEAAQIAAEGIEIKELQSTLPPLKLDLSAPPTPPSGALNGAFLPFRETQSYEGLPGPSTQKDASAASKSVENVNGRDFHSPTSVEETEVRMSFEPTEERSNSRTASSIASLSRSPSPKRQRSRQNGYGHSDENVSMTFETPIGSRSHSPSKKLDTATRYEPSPRQPQSKVSRSPSPAKVEASQHNGYHNSPPKPDLAISEAQQPPVVSLDRNVWADEDENFGEEKEMTMTFE